MNGTLQRKPNEKSTQSLLKVPRAKEVGQEEADLRGLLRNDLHNRLQDCHTDPLIMHTQLNQILQRPRLPILSSEDLELDIDQTPLARAGEPSRNVGSKGEVFGEGDLVEKSVV
jgi:hypothetical protein